ncbi:MAG: hypothetical protein HY586_05725 [Candidatus Omnitrophica bacterium]|nr:hypothetical protein [Candidatus Omnitrophota bacterium]
MIRQFGFIIFLFLFAGCARLFGWDIHAPGVLSSNFQRQVHPMPARIALYLPQDTFHYVSQDRGGRFADPQIYHIGEAWSPMMIEGMQNAFHEFIFMEVKPSVEILNQYKIPYLAVVRLTGFKNRVTLKGQAVSVFSEAVVYNSNREEIARFRARGTSDAKKVFKKKGGPEVNLNAAIEENVLSVTQYLQDLLRK